MGILFASDANKPKNNPLNFLYMSVLGFILIACTADPDVLPDAPVDRESKEIGTGNVWPFCHDNKEAYAPPPLEYWVKKNTAIFTGKAVERRLKFPDNNYFNGCWVKFKTDEILKGSIGKEIWVKAYYDLNEQSYDIFAYKNCPIVAGNKYIILGTYFPADKYDPEIVFVYKDIYMPPRYTCAPLEKFPKAKDIVEKIKTIIKGDK